jgi:hypothetical protein
MGKDFLRQYTDHIGAVGGVGGIGAGIPSSTTVDWDAKSTWLWTGRSFLFRAPRR